MNFTREPIIETIITPREGCRLTIRSSKNDSQEEFTVDAVEVVSFSNALFFRSLERPRPFLVPVTDYEVVEAKESRPVLKNAPHERTIKIGGGREASLRKEEEEEPALPLALEDELEESETSKEPSGEPTRDPTRDQYEPRGRKRDRRRHRRHRPHEDREPQQRTEQPTQEPKTEAPVVAKEAPSFTHLIPPPTTLISDTIHKYKEQQSQPEPEKKEEPKEAPNGDSTPISRVAVEPFPSVNDWSNFLS